VTGSSASWSNGKIEFVSSFGKTIEFICFEDQVFHLLNQWMLLKHGCTYCMRANICTCASAHAFMYVYARAPRRGPTQRPCVGPTQGGADFRGAKAPRSKGAVGWHPCRSLPLGSAARRRFAAPRDLSRRPRGARAVQGGMLVRARVLVCQMATPQRLCSRSCMTGVCVRGLA
jgi:hypothetical protein